MTGTTSLGMMDGASQLAWVTRDLGSAIAAFTPRFPEARFSCHAIDLPCIGRTERCSARVGLAWLGSLQLELIEPVSGAVELYEEHLPREDAVAAFHHVGIKVPGAQSDWQRRRETMLTSGLSVTLEGGIDDRVKFAYFDLRAALGHYVELIWLNGPFLSKAPIP